MQRTVPSAAALLLATLGLVCPRGAAGECRALVVAGDPGTEPDAAARFEGWTARWARLLTDVYGFKPPNVRVLRSPSRQAGAPAVPPADLASHENVLAAFATLVRESGPGDQAVLVLIGHGYDSQDIGRLCLPGRDLSDVEAGRALEPLRAKELICIAASPASVTWAKALCGKGRVVITAAGKPGMRSQTYFCEFLLRALQPGNVSLLDAFNRASLETIRWYQNQFVDGDVTTVHGRDFQAIWKAMYPGRKMEAGSAEPKDPTNDPEQQEAWLGRRVIPEVAGLEDNGDGTPSTILEEETKVVPLPSKSGDGEASRRIVLGKP